MDGKKKRPLLLLRLLLAVIMLASFAAPLFPPEGGGGEAAVRGYTCVLELWHIDLFEGGTGSRADFLSRRAVDYRKTRPGVFVLVRSVTETELISKLSEGVLPDLFSFSPGIGEKLLPYLAEYGASGYEASLKPSVMRSGKSYALPWCKGGYAFIAFTDALRASGASEEGFLALPFDSKLADKHGNLLVAGYAAYNSPLAAARAAGFKGNLPEEKPTQYEAYREFYSRRAPVLLGTQRDLMRLENASLSGAVPPYSVSPVGGYTDLITAIGICSATDYADEADGFARYLLTDGVQSKLTGIGMLSVTGLKLYSDKGRAALEQALSDGYSAPNLFLVPSMP